MENYSLTFLLSEDKNEKIWKTKVGWASRSPSGEIRYFYDSVTSKNDAHKWSMGGVAANSQKSDSNGKRGKYRGKDDLAYSKIGFRSFDDYKGHIEKSHAVDEKYKDIVNAYSNNTKEINSALQNKSEISDNVAEVISGLDKAIENSSKTTRPLMAYKAIRSKSTLNKMEEKLGSKYRERTYLTAHLRPLDAINEDDLQSTVVAMMEILIPVGVNLLNTNNGNKNNILIQRESLIQIESQYKKTFPIKDEKGRTKSRIYPVFRCSLIKKNQDDSMKDGEKGKTNGENEKNEKQQQKQR